MWAGMSLAGRREGVDEDAPLVFFLRRMMRGWRLGCEG